MTPKKTSLERKQVRAGRRYDRRVGRTPITDAKTQDMLMALSQMRQDVDNKLPAGSYLMNEKRIIKYPGAGEDVIEHEKVHAAQHNMLGRLRVQDPEIRKASRALNKSITEDQLASFTEAGKYIRQPHELEAHLRGAAPMIKSLGLKDSSFDEILIGLQRAEEEGVSNQNMRNLMLFMQNEFTPEQKNIIESAFKSSGI